MSRSRERVTAFDEVVDTRLERHRSPALDRVFYSLSSAADDGMLWHAIGIVEAVRRRQPLFALRFSAALGQSPQRRYLEWVAIFRESQRAALFSDDFIAQLPESDPLAFIATAWKRVGRRDAVTAASLTDLVTYLPCDLMTKVDVASMNSKNVRAE